MNAIEIRNLTKEYKDFKLDGLSLTLPEGCIMGLVGENGAGKSTAIRLMLGLARRDGGSVSLLGNEIGEGFARIKEEIGIVLDDVGISACLTPRQVGKIMKNTYSNWDDEAYSGYLRRFALPENKKFGDFSKGMKMKLGLAAALSHKPRLLILDEATAGLDPIIRDELLDIFMEFTRDEKNSILISSHIVSDLEKICDYIAFIHRGKLMLCEEKDALREEYGVVRCSAEELDKIPDDAVKGRKETPYGVEAIVRRSALPEGAEAGVIDIEQLFIFMTKGEGEK